MAELKNASFTGKSKDTLPAGAKVIKQTTNVEVEEIENGFLVTKRTEYEYQMKDKGYTDWKTIYKKYYSKTNPLTIDLDDIGKESIADKF